MSFVKSLVSAVALSACAAPAMAQSTGNFDGFFIGGEVGAQRNTASFEAPDNIRLKDKKTNYALRSFAGYDLTIGDAVVLGAEAGVGLGGPDVKGSSGTAKFEADIGLTFDASARAGLLLTPGTLVYGRLGYANTKVDIIASNSEPTLATISQDKREGGLLYGAGLEFALSDDIHLRTEYRRMKTGPVKSQQAMVGLAVTF